MFSCWPLGQVDGRGDEIPREYKLQTPGDDDAATMANHGVLEGSGPFFWTTDLGRTFFELLLPGEKVELTGMQKHEALLLDCI